MAQGKTAPEPVRTDSGSKGPDPLQSQDDWGDWLVQNAKGRVRTLGGLGRHETSGFLGSLSASGGGVRRGLSERAGGGNHRRTPEPEHSGVPVGQLPNGSRIFSDSG